VFFFLGYGIGKQIFCLPDTYKDPSGTNLVRIGLAGATSGFFTTPILAPLERLKCILQIQNASTDPKTKRFKGPIDLAKHIIKQEGFMALNRGYWATNLRDSLASIAYFTTYEVLKRRLTPEGQLPAWYWTLFAGGMAGIANWIPAIPVDTLKSRLQTAPPGKYRGIRDVAREIITQEGARGVLTMYRGVGPVMLRAFPANAACFLGYETAMQVLNKIM